METYNLTFAGEILPGHDPGEARTRFGRALGIDDPDRLQAFFSGKVITLRRNLEREAATSLQQRMAKIGIRLTLVSNSGQIDLDLAAAEPPDRPRKTAGDHGSKASRGNTTKKAVKKAAKEAVAETTGAAPILSAPASTRPTRAGSASPPEKTASTRSAGHHGAPSSAARPSAGNRRRPAAVKGNPSGARKAPPQASAERAARDRKNPARRPKRHTVGALVRGDNQPNLFALQPFRNNARVQHRSDRAASLAQAGLWLGGFALVALLMLALRFLTLPGAPPLPQLLALAASDNGRLLAASADTLYLLDRSGSAESEVSLNAIGLPPVRRLLFGTADRVWAIAPTESGSSALWRCTPYADPVTPCESLRAGLGANTGLAVDAGRSVLFIADPVAQTVSRLNSRGEILATAAATVPAEPLLLVRDGLLYLNQPDGPLLQVLRPDTAGFGQVLDQLYLMPAQSTSTAYARIADLTATDGHWWALLEDAEGQRDLFRFNAAFSPGQPKPLPPSAGRPHLLEWQERLLVYTDSPQVARFAADGTDEVALDISALAQQRQQLHDRQTLARALWGSAFLLLALLAVGGFSAAAYQRLRALVYRSGRQRGADSVENIAAEVAWVEHNRQRSRDARRLLAMYSGLVAVVLLVAVLAKVPLATLSALLIIACGPAAALVLLALSPTGHIGQLRDRLLVVDHRGRYHLGEGARIQYRDNFVLIDDVVVFLGTRLLPNFDIGAIQRDIEPLVTAGVRIQRRAIAVRLLENRHPLSLALLAVFGSLLLGLCIVVVSSLW